MKTRPKRQTLRRALIICSFILFPVTIFYCSPALIVMGAAQGVVSGSAILFAGQFLSALALGRAFCGWVCPGAGLQEACGIAQPKRVNGRKCDWIKYLLWVPWAATFAALFSRNGIQTIQPLFMMDSPISLSSPVHYPVYLIVTGLIFVLSLTVGRRGFCHTACWMAPFMIAGLQLQTLLRLPALHLRPDPTKCVDCLACTGQCPMSLHVTDMVRRGNMRNSECVLCGNCVDACRAGAISFAFGVSRKANTPAVRNV